MTKVRLKRTQTHFPLDSSDEENYELILAEWLQAIELLAHGYQQVNLLLAVSQSPIFPPTQFMGLNWNSQVESDLKQLQQEACMLLGGLSDQMQRQDCSPKAPLTVSQLRQHTVLISELNQRLQDTLYRISPSYTANRFNLN
ncbi:hypothetical protein GCM10028808_71260 [Spirosoma migulaei]